MHTVSDLTLAEFEEMAVAAREGRGTNPDHRRY
jgi:hypothetical protein